MTMAKTKHKDRSAAAGLGTTAGAAVTEGAAVVALTGGSASASAITYALGTIGGLVGGGMAAGLGLLIGVHALVGGAAYGISKVVKKRRGKIGEQDCLREETTLLSVAFQRRQHNL